MGWFSRKPTKPTKPRGGDAYIQARTAVWNAEIEKLGVNEFHRRQSAVTDYQLGKTGPSGFEEWEQQLAAAVERRADEIFRGSS